MNLNKKSKNLGQRSRYPAQPYDFHPWPQASIDNIPSSPTFPSLFLPPREPRFFPCSLSSSRPNELSPLERPNSLAAVQPPWVFPSTAKLDGPLKQQHDTPMPGARQDPNLRGSKLRRETKKTTKTITTLKIVECATEIGCCGSGRG